jgi:hypothetical protein
MNQIAKLLAVQIMKVGMPQASDLSSNMRNLHSSINATLHSQPGTDQAEQDHNASTSHISLAILRNYAEIVLCRSTSVLSPGCHNREVGAEAPAACWFERPSPDKSESDRQPADQFCL